MTDEEARRILAEQERNLNEALKLTPEAIKAWYEAQAARLKFLERKWQLEEEERKRRHPCGCFYGCPSCQPNRKWYR